MHMKTKIPMNDHPRIIEILGMCKASAAHNFGQLPLNCVTPPVNWFTGGAHFTIGKRNCGSGVGRLPLCFDLFQFHNFGLLRIEDEDDRNRE